MSLFQTVFIKMLSEDMTSASAFTSTVPTAGSGGGGIGNQDSYAPGDARKLPHILDGEDIFNQKKKKKKKKKRSKNKNNRIFKGRKKSKHKISNPNTFNVMRRSFSGMSGPGQKVGVSSMPGFGTA